MQSSEATFVFRLGPVDFGGEQACWYVLSPAIPEVFYGNDEAEVLGRIKAALPGRRLQCEPALAAVGQPLGYEVRTLTAFEVSARARLWLNAEAALWYETITNHVAQGLLLEHATRLAARGQWIAGVIELDVAIRGHAMDQVFDETISVVWTGNRGLFAFESHVAMRAFQDQTVGGDLAAADAIPRWVLEFARGSEGLQGAMCKAYGVPDIPVVSHHGTGGRRPIDLREGWRMALMLRAVDAWVMARAERATARFVVADVDTAMEAVFLRALVDGPDGKLITLGWSELAARLP